MNESKTLKEVEILIAHALLRMAWSRLDETKDPDVRLDLGHGLSLPAGDIIMAADRQNRQGKNRLALVLEEVAQPAIEIDVVEWTQTGLQLWELYITRPELGEVEGPRVCTTACARGCEYGHCWTVSFVECAPEGDNRRLECRHCPAVRPYVEPRLLDAV